MMNLESARPSAALGRRQARPVVGSIGIGGGGIGCAAACVRQGRAARAPAVAVAARAPSAPQQQQQQDNKQQRRRRQQQQQPAAPSPLTSFAQILAGGAGSTLSAAQQLLVRGGGGNSNAAAASAAARATTTTPTTTVDPKKKRPPFRGPPTTNTHPLPLRLGWAGSGLFFWWQLGAVAYLRGRYDLTRVRQVGASGGALAAALAACDACPDRTMDVALELSERYGVWSRPLGLMGVWGRIVEEWLEALLPEDAHERCSGRVGVVYTVLPSCEQVVAEHFATRRDLIDCLLASAHVPFFLDFRLARPVRGALAVDGSFPDFFTEQNSSAVTGGGEALVFDYYSDARLVRGSRLDMLALREPDAIRHVMRLGYEYAHRLHDPEAPPEPDSGGLPLGAVHGLGGGAAFSRFDWQGLALDPEVAATRSPGLPPRNVTRLGVPHGAPLPWASSSSSEEDEDGEDKEAARAAG